MICPDCGCSLFKGDEDYSECLFCGKTIYKEEKKLGLDK